MTSSKTLKAEIQEHGVDYTDHFDFEVLFFCGDRNSLVLGEMMVQIEEDVIHNPNNYNRAIAGQRFIGPTQHTPETREKMRLSHSGRNAGIRNPSFVDWVVGINVKTGDRIELCGKHAMKDAGFDQSNISKCIRGVPHCKTHKGYKWYWKSEYKEE